jgi:hypothetical protein
VAYIFSGELSPARADLTGAIAAAPQLYPAYLSLAFLELRAKNRAAAAAALDKGLAAAARAAAAGTEFTREQEALLESMAAARASLPGAGRRAAGL